MSDNLHPVRRVTVGERSADIDEELAPIIEVIWRLGLTTWTSCQNAGESNAGPRDAFYLRMTHWAAPDSWHVNARPMDRATFDQLQESRFALRLLLVRFPSYDRAEMLRRLTTYAAGRLTAPGPIDRSSMNPG